MRNFVWLSVACMFACGSADATVLFSDNFESYSLGPLPTGGNWATNFTGEVVNDPFGGGHGQVLDFTGNGSGGDLWSQLISYVPATNNMLQISFDIALTFVPPSNGSGGSGYVYMGQDTATNPFGSHTELWTLGSDTTGFYEDPSRGGPYVSNPAHAVNTWYHISLNFFPFDNTNFAIKFESRAHEAFIDNIFLVDNAPEPATVACVFTGLLGLAVLRRRRPR
jgi:hypothetical protein